MHQLNDQETDLLRSMHSDEPVHWDSVPAWVIVSLFNWGFIEPVEPPALWALTFKGEDAFV